MNSRKILITGSAGFIGFHVARRLLERGDQIVGLDNINDYYDVRLKYARLAETGIEEGKIRDGILVGSSKYPDYSFIRQDIKDQEPLNQLFEKERFDIVVHLAAQAGVRFSLENPSAYADSNLVGFVNLIEACRLHGVRHLVYASSSSVYGSNASIPFSTADNTDHPVSLYGATKKSNEVIAHSYSFIFRLPTTGLRFFTVYGPWGRPDMAYFRFVHSILDDKPIDIYNRGAMKRDFTYIADVTECVVRIIDMPPTGDDNPQISVSPYYRILNIGNGSPVDLMEFIGLIEKALGKSAEKRLLPMQPGDVATTWADTSDLRREIDYQPATPLEKGIGAFIEWYLNYHKQV